MTAKQYLKALDKLGLTPAGRATAQALGVSLRQVQRYASGEHAIPGSVALLIAMYMRYGLPKPD